MHPNRYRLALASVLLTVTFCLSFAMGQDNASYDPRKDPLVNPKSLFEKPASPSDVATDETLYLQFDGNPSNLMPLFQSSLYEQTMASVLYDGPFNFDREMKWILNPSMVDSYVESDDHKTATLKLKPGLKWQDGHPFTAHDIVFSWQQILDERVPALAARSGTDEITECTALDDLTVRYFQPTPLATSKWNVLFPIVPKHIFEKEKQAHPDLLTGEYYNKQARFPVGNGPYKIVEWVNDDKIVVERWEDYPGTKPYFKRIVFRITPDPNVTLLRFEKAEIDVIRRLTAEQFVKETNRDTFKRVGYKAWGTEWAYSHIGWNMDKSNPFFHDKKVRIAMSHAFNLPKILDRVFYNLYTPCLGVFHPDSWMFNKEVKGIVFDLKKAAALLDEAGWKEDPSDGWRYKVIDGKKIPFEFTIFVPQGAPSSEKIVAIYQQDLKKIGIRMKSRTLEWSALHSKIEKHEFQAEISSWGTGTDPDTNSNLFQAKEYKAGRNYGGYSNPEVDQLFEDGKREFDPAKRAVIYQKIHKLIYDDQPSIFIANVPTLAAANKRMRGLQFSPRGLFGFDPSFFAWWTPSAKPALQP